MIYTQTTELYHHGIKGQKWGIRRYQNEDGSFTEEGKQRYYIDSNGKMSFKGRQRFRNDQQALKGKHLAEKGQTITGNSAKAGYLNAALLIGGGLAIGAAKNRYEHNIGSAATVNALAALGGLAAAGAIANTVATGIQNNRLRKYYNHEGSLREFEIKK